MKKISRIPPFIIALIAIELLLVALYIGNWAIGRPFSKLTYLTDMDGEASICCWFSVVQLSFAATISMVIAYARFERKNILSWSLFGIPIVLILLSMDEQVQIHEWLGVRSDILLEGGSRANTPYSQTGIWSFLLGIPFMACFLTYIYLLKKYVRDAFNYTIFTFGILIFLFGAMTHDALSNIFPDTTILSGVIVVSCEEFLEMFGVTVIIMSMFDVCQNILKGQRDTARRRD
jgi:hypothetical protein